MRQGHQIFHTERRQLVMSKHKKFEDDLTARFCCTEEQWMMQL